MYTEVILPCLALDWQPMPLRGPHQPHSFAKVQLIGGEEACLQMFLNAMRQMSTWDLVEELCAFQVWPLAQGWNLSLGAEVRHLPVIEMEGLDGG